MHLHRRAANCQVESGGREGGSNRRLETEGPLPSSLSLASDPVIKRSTALNPLFPSVVRTLLDGCGN